MKRFDEYLYKKVEIVCTDKSEFVGEVTSFGGSVQGEEEYGIAEDFLCINTRGGNYLFFRSEIAEIIEM